MVEATGPQKVVNWSAIAAVLERSSASAVI